MENKILIWSACFLLFAVGSCTKFGKNITIEGRVLNPITGKGISGVEIWLLKTTMGLPGGDKTIKTVFSNKNGKLQDLLVQQRGQTPLCLHLGTIKI